jgi:hypothetical protein
MNRPSSLLAFAFLLSACSGIPTESKLVGTWAGPERTTRSSEFGYIISQSKEMVYVHFFPDHTFAWSRHDPLAPARPTDVGRWQLNGRNLTWTFTNPATGRKAGASSHDTIVELTNQKLIYVQGAQGSDAGADAVGEVVHLTRH